MSKPTKKEHPEHPELVEYLNGLSDEDREYVAAYCSTSVQYLFQIGRGNKPCVESKAIDLDRVTNGEVSMFNLRPDVDWDWVAQRAS